MVRYLLQDRDQGGDKVFVERRVITYQSLKKSEGSAHHTGIWEDRGKGGRG